jgi:hypothetical protein
MVVSIEHGGRHPGNANGAEIHHDGVKANAVEEAEKQLSRLQASGPS